MHDRNGNKLEIGDHVLIPARVTHLSPGEDYCNVSVETTTCRRPDDKPERLSALNTGVLVKVGSAVCPLGI